MGMETPAPDGMAQLRIDDTSSGPPIVSVKRLQHSSQEKARNVD
jgi:hypothetical protein